MCVWGGGRGGGVIREGLRVAAWVWISLMCVRIGLSEERPPWCVFDMSVYIYLGRRGLSLMCLLIGLSVPVNPWMSTGSCARIDPAHLRWRVPA